jgi:hypothetical protein
MSHLPPEIPVLNCKELRKFALTTGGILALLFGLFFPWLLDARFPIWPWIVAGLLGAWGLVAPLSLQPLYRAWMKFGLLLGKITTPLILGIVFYGLILPMGLVMRLAGHDPMARRIDDATESYRITRAKPPRKNMERPF